MKIPVGLPLHAGSCRFGINKLIFMYITVGVIAVLGSTFTGHYEPVEEICEVLDEIEMATGVDIGVHVDAAGGGLVAPFVDSNIGPW
jgi:glutamate/tyrosine decarboxylase-like PLP-dependent enzyme